MIHSELPKSIPATNRTYQKKHTSIITPDRSLLNEKPFCSLMFASIGMIIITWAFKKWK